MSGGGADAIGEVKKAFDIENAGLVIDDVATPFGVGLTGEIHSECKAKSDLLFGHSSDHLRCDDELTIWSA